MSFQGIEQIRLCVLTSRLEDEACPSGKIDTPADIKAELYKIERVWNQGFSNYPRPSLGPIWPGYSGSHMANGMRDVKRSASMAASRTSIEGVMWVAMNVASATALHLGRISSDPNDYLHRLPLVDSVGSRTSIFSYALTNDLVASGTAPDLVSKSLLSIRRQYVSVFSDMELTSGMRFSMVN